MHHKNKKMDTLEQRWGQMIQGVGGYPIRAGGLVAWAFGELSKLVFCWGRGVWVLCLLLSLSLS